MTMVLRGLWPRSFQRTSLLPPVNVLSFHRGVFYGDYLTKQSTEGLLWQRFTGPRGSGAGIVEQSHAFLGNIFLSIVNTPTNMMSISTDGVSWTNLGTSELDRYTDATRRISVARGRFVMYGLKADSTGPLARHSTDGVSWSDCVLPAEFTSTQVPTYLADNGSVAVLRSRGVASYSTDGVSWSLAPQLAAVMGSSNAVVVAGGGMFLIPHAPSVFVSNDGITWRAAGSGGWVLSNGAAYGNGKWVVREGAGQYRTSLDNGSTWSALQAFPIAIVTNIVFGNGLFVYCGPNGAGQF